MNSEQDKQWECFHSVCVCVCTLLHTQLYTHTYLHTLNVNMTKETFKL